MPRLSVLITVKAYPVPSRTYDDLVCTAGITENGQWIRIYPVPFRALVSNEYFRKYQWIELDLQRRDDRDFRPGSYSPAAPDLRDLTRGDLVDTKDGWSVRRSICLRNAYGSLSKLISDSQDPTNVSLATFQPKEIRRFVVERTEREWKETWQEQLRQLDMFVADRKGKTRVPIPKVPYRFKYQLVDSDGTSSTMTIEDWEIGALYWNCLKRAEGNEDEAISRVRLKYEDEFLGTKDLYLFLGTTLQYHRRRTKNPFTIIGVFYPPREKPTTQHTLFE